MITGTTSIKFEHRVITKAPGLLPMKYKLGEIATKLDVNPRTLSDWTNHGMPHEHDSRGHIWIIGTDFAEWVEQSRKMKKKASGDVKLADNEAYCLKCRKAVVLENPTTTQAQGKLIYIKGICPTCGNTINRGGRRND